MNENNVAKISDKQDKFNPKFRIGVNFGVRVRSRDRLKFRSKVCFVLDFRVNRYRRKRPKVDASIFESALSHTRRSDASKKREENIVSTFGRFRLWTSFESSPVSVNVYFY